MRVLLVSENEKTKITQLREDFNKAGLVCEIETDLNNLETRLNHEQPFDLIFTDQELNEYKNAPKTIRTNFQMVSSKKLINLAIWEIVEGREFEYPIIEAGPFKINLDTKTVEIDGKETKFTKKEFSTLTTLCLFKNVVLPINLIEAHLYNSDEDIGHKIINVFLCKIRKKETSVTKRKSKIETI